VGVGDICLAYISESKLIRGNYGPIRYRCVVGKIL
jgi:hypothetical protein